MMVMMTRKNLKRSKRNSKRRIRKISQRKEEERKNDAFLLSFSL
jgi:hypothetical protein